MADNNERRIKALVSQYENYIRTGGDFYMEALDLLDVIDYYLKAGRTEEADSCLAFALQLHPTDEGVLVTKAYRLKEKGYWETAGLLVRSLNDQDARDVQFFYIEEHVAAFRLNEAERVFLKLCDAAPSDGASSEDEYRIAFAEILLDYDLPLRALNWLDRISPDALPDLEESIPGVSKKHLYELRGEALYAMQQCAGAAAQLEHAIDLDPYDSVLWEQLADVYYADNNIDEALEACDYVLDINPRSLRALRVRCLAYAAQGATDRLAQAYDRLREVREPDTEEYTFYYSVAGSLRSTGHDAEALAWMRLAFRNCLPTSSDYTNLLAELADILLDSDDAAGHLDALIARAVALRQSPFPVLFNVVKRLFEKGRMREAVNFLSRILRYLDPNLGQESEIVRLLNAHHCYGEAARIWQRLYQDLKDASDVGEEFGEAFGTLPPGTLVH